MIVTSPSGHRCLFAMICLAASPSDFRNLTFLNRSNFFRCFGQLLHWSPKTWRNLSTDFEPEILRPKFGRSHGIVQAQATIQSLRARQVGRRSAVKLWTHLIKRLLKQRGRTAVASASHHEMGIPPFRSRLQAQAELGRYSFRVMSTWYLSSSEFVRYVLGITIWHPELLKRSQLLLPATMLCWLGMKGTKES